MSDALTDKIAKLKYTPDQLYSAFSQAETGGEVNPYIRTKYAPKQGSTAFGPVQITYNTAKDYANRGLLSGESTAFFKQVLEPMYQKFNKYGREPKKEGYSPEYDYGGTGGFDPNIYSAQYEQLAKEMLQYHYKNAGGDINQTITKWRGVPNDNRYIKEVSAKLK